VAKHERLLQRDDRARRAGRHIRGGTRALGGVMTFDAVLPRVIAEPSNGGGVEAERASRGADDAVGAITPNSSRGRRRLPRILEAASQLFLRDGYSATSIEAVLEASGGSKATLYSYFSTKDELFRAVVKEAIRNEARPTLAL